MEHILRRRLPAKPVLIALGISFGGLLAVGALLASGFLVSSAGSGETSGPGSCSVSSSISTAAKTPAGPRIGPQENTILPEFRKGYGQFSIDMKLLVVSADGKETDFPAIIATLDQIGIPYDTLIATQNRLTPSTLSDGSRHGYYQGIILSTGNLTYDAGGGNWQSAFTAADWQTMWQYEAKFGIRQVTSFTYPSGAPDNYGLELIRRQDTTAEPLTVGLTPEGKRVFWYLNPASPIDIRLAWTYLARIVDPSVTTPLLVTPRGEVVAAIHRYADGRENLAVTAANNPNLLHSMLLSYGVVNWVTRGVFLGERHVNLDVQVDDVLIGTRMWDTAAVTDTTGLTYRINGEDLNATRSWLSYLHTSVPNAGALTLDLVFNGRGATVYSPDTLTPAVIAQEQEFNWVSHTFSHVELDAVTYAEAISELRLNHEAAQGSLGLTRYWCDALVQPSISGLDNPEFLRAARDFGIRYIISDYSRPAWRNPSANVGLRSRYEPGIVIVPRRAVGLPFSVSTPEQWVSAYNWFFGAQTGCPDGTPCRNERSLTYGAILDQESEALLSYLLKWDLDPLMFHQPNLRAYDGKHSVLTDLLNATLAKYNRVYDLPIRGLSQHEVGSLMANRMAYNAAKVRGTLVPCTSITIEASQPAMVPVTGVAYSADRDAYREVYGGQSISYVPVDANRPVKLLLPACQ